MKLGAVFDISGGRIHIGKRTYNTHKPYKKYKTKHTGWQTSYVKCMQDMEVPANDSRIIRVTTNAKWEKDIPGMFAPRRMYRMEENSLDAIFGEDNDLCLMTGIVTPDAREFNLIIYNSTDLPKIVTEGAVLGTLAEVTEILPQTTQVPRCSRMKAPFADKDSSTTEVKYRHKPFQPGDDPLQFMRSDDENVMLPPKEWKDVDLSVHVPPHLQCHIDHLPPGLALEEIAQVKILLNNYQKVFSMDGEPLGRTGLTTHTIETQAARPIKQPLRRMPFTACDFGG